MKTAQDYLKAAREALEAGDLAKAEQMKDAAKTAITIDREEAAVKALDASHAKAQRLPYGDTDGNGSIDTAQDAAVKSFYVARYGDVDAQFDVVMKDLYGNNYQHTAYAKGADFLRFVRSGVADPRLSRLMLYSDAQIKAMVHAGLSVAELKNVQLETQDSLGGYLVPEDFRDRVVQRMTGMTAVRKTTTPITTDRDGVTMPVLAGGDSRRTSSARGRWVASTPTSDQSKTVVNFAQTSIPVHVVMANVPISKTLLEDTRGATAITSIVERALADEFAMLEDEAFLVGDGVGKPSGILRDATTGGFNTLSYGTSRTVASGAATKLSADAVRNLPLAIDSQYRNAGGFWIMSRGSVRVIGNLKTGSGDYLWADRNRQLQDGRPMTLEGYPILESEVLAAPSTDSGDTYAANVYPILFVIRDGYQIVERVGMSLQRYDDSTTAGADQIVFYARHRVGGQVIEPWKIAAIKIAAS